MTAALIGLGLAGAGMFMDQKDKPKEKSMSTLSPIQRRAYNMMVSQAQSRLGRWVKTPRGMVFEYDPEPPPQYPLPRVAPLTNLQQQSIGQASNLMGQQGQLMGGAGGYGDFFNKLSQYKPGQAAAGGLPAVNKPQPEQAPPYQFAEQALTGMQLPRPDIGREPQYLPQNWKIPDAYVDPYAVNARPQNWQGRMGTEQFSAAMQNTPAWNPAWGNVPQVGYLEPPKKTKRFGALGALFGVPPPCRSYYRAQYYANYATERLSRRPTEPVLSPLPIWW